MGKSIQVMLVDDSEEARQSLRMLLDFADDVQVVSEATDGSDALQKLDVIMPDVVIMDINMPVMDGVTATEKICTQYPLLNVIVVSVQNDVEYVRRCMRAGAKDYLFKPVDGDTLIATIRDVVQTEQIRHTKGNVAVLNQQIAQKAKIISLISAKGGVGKTTIAVNTATALAMQGKRVALVDFDLQFGDVSLFMNLSPSRTVIELIRESNDIDPDVLDRYLTPHSSGVQVLAAPKRPEEAEYVLPANIRVILQSLRRKFDYVIVDTAPVANDVFFAILETSDDCFIVNTLNLAVLKNNRMLLELLALLGYDTEEIKHLLNRSTSKNGLKVRDLAKILGTDPIWEMDNDYHLAESSINEGTPFVIKDAKNRLSKQIYAFTVRIDESQGIRMSRRNPLRKLFAIRR